MDWYGWQRYAPGVPVTLMDVAAVLFGAGITLVVEAMIERAPRPTLYERLAPFQRPYVADEAQRWLEEN